MKHSHTIPTTTPKERRQLAKAKREMGLKYLGDKGIDPVKWCQDKDPLFKVKGKERYEKTKS